MEAFRNGDLGEVELRLINVSLEDDSLIGSLLDAVENKEPCESLFGKDVDMKDMEDTAAASVLEVLHDMPTNCSEQGKPNTFGKCNLRKSLAWDSAFFTSSGILEPEELTSMIEEVKMREKKSLPAIKEDMHNSTESLSTLDNENFALEGLEDDLFKDVRASIQASKKAPNLPKPSGKTAPRITASSKSSAAPQTSRAKLVPTKKSNSNNTNTSDKTRHSDGRRQTLQGKKAGSSPPKPPEILTKTSSLSTAESKRASLSANHLNRATRNIGVNIQSNIPTRVPSKPRATTSSIKPPSTPSSKSNGKTPLNLQRKKPEPNSIPRSPYITSSVKKNAAKSKKSASTPCSSVSPASSVTSLESSSSNSTFNRSSNSSFISIGSISHTRSIAHLSNATQKQLNKALEVPKSEVPSSAKPSGLRRPSPKIGFFDGTKPVVQTPKKTLPTHSRMPTALPKVGIVRRVSGKVNPGKAQSHGHVESSKPVQCKDSTPSIDCMDSSNKSRSPAVSSNSENEFFLKLERQVREEVTSNKNEASDSLKDAIINNESCLNVEEQVDEQVLKTEDPELHSKVDEESSHEEVQGASDLKLNPVSDLVVEVASETEGFQHEEECNNEQQLCEEHGLTHLKSEPLMENLKEDECSNMQPLCEDLDLTHLKSEPLTETGKDGSKHEEDGRKAETSITLELTTGSNLSLDSDKPLMKMTMEVEDLPCPDDQEGKNQEEAITTELNTGSSMNADICETEPSAEGKGFSMNEPHLANGEKNEVMRKPFVEMTVDSLINGLALLRIDTGKCEEAKRSLSEASETAELAVASNFGKNWEEGNSFIVGGRSTSGRIPLAVRNSLLGNDALLSLQKVEDAKKVAAAVPILKEN